MLFVFPHDVLFLCLALGFTLLNGWTTWQATEGTLKQWGLDDVTETQKFLFQTMGANMFGVSAAGVALLKGKSLGTALGKPNCI